MDNPSPQIKLRGALAFDAAYRYDYSFLWMAGSTL